MSTIGPATTLVPTRDTTTVVVDDEQFVFRVDRGSVHRLTGTAAIVWQVLDGDASLYTLAGELADVYGSDEGAILEDLERLGDQLTGLGLARDVDEPDAAPPLMEPVPEPRYVAVPPST